MATEDNALLVILHVASTPACYCSCLCYLATARAAQCAHEIAFYERLLFLIMIIIHANY